MPVIRIPAAFRPYADGTGDMSVSGDTVSGALDQLLNRFPSLAQRLYRKTGTLRHHINLFVNDSNIKDLTGLDTRLQENDKLIIVISIAGG